VLRPKNSWASNVFSVVKNWRKIWEFCIQSCIAQLHGCTAFDAVTTWFDLRIRKWLTKEVWESTWILYWPVIWRACGYLVLYCLKITLLRTLFFSTMDSIFLYEKGKRERIFYSYSLLSPTYGLASNVLRFIHWTNSI